MGEIPLPLGVRAAAFVARLAEQAIQLPPQQVLTSEQQERLSGEATQLLRRLVVFAKPSLLTEEIDNREKRRFTANYLTPFIRVVEEGEDPEQAPAFAISVEASRYYDVMAAGSEQGDIGLEEVSAIVLLLAPGQSEPLPIIELEGKETAHANLVSTKISVADGFFTDPEDESETVIDRFAQIRETLAILDAIGPVLEGGVHNALTVNGQEGHILTTRDWRDGEQQMFIPHSEGRAA